MIEAKNVKEAANYLRQHQFVPVQIIPEEKTGIIRYLPFLRRTKSSDVIFFTRQLASMISSGLTLVQALNILKNQTQSIAMKEIVEGIISDIEDGSKLSKAVEKYPHTFSFIYVALVKTAESSGLLDKVLTRLAEDLEKSDKLVRTIRGALMYPFIVVVMMILVMIVMMIFVIPQLTVLYGNLNLSLPLPTVIVIGISDFLTHYWYIAIAMAVGITFYLRSWYHKPEGKKTVDTYILKLPIFGNLLRDSMMAEFARTLSLLISSGSLVVDSLLKSGDVLGNMIYKDAIALVAKRVEKGISMGDAMEATPTFPPMIVEMVKIGEQTGKLDSSLMKASEYYEREVEEKVKVMTTLMEPIIMVMLALGVGFLIIAIITPIYNLISNIS
ncbi:MAG TPA: type II secretion system F family protein [Candidatus Sulfotelmatobacter sp.]|nr:type II secretion system F family protein [Candidatus Sulfotelmatobacter sp.]